MKRRRSPAAPRRRSRRRRCEPATRLRAWRRDAGRAPRNARHGRRARAWRRSSRPHHRRRSLRCAHHASSVDGKDWCRMTFTLNLLQRNRLACAKRLGDRAAIRVFSVASASVSGNGASSRTASTNACSSTRTRRRSAPRTSAGPRCGCRARRRCRGRSRLTLEPMPMRPACRTPRSRFHARGQRARRLQHGELAAFELDRRDAVVDVAALGEPFVHGDQARTRRRASRAGRPAGIARSRRRGCSCRGRCRRRWART